MYRGDPFRTVLVVDFLLLYGSPSLSKIRLFKRLFEAVPIRGQLYFGPVTPPCLNV
jgi:hypothetical protein